MELINMIRTLDETIFDSRENSSIGLADGKMGYCIYFYYIGRITDNKEYRLKAELLIDEIIEHINEIKIYDVKNDLSSVGLGVDYLIKNKYIEGDSNVILKDIDNILFKQLCYLDKFNDYDLSLQLQLIYYFTVRLEKQKKNSENEYLFREVIISSINHLSEKYNLLFSEEPVSFSMENSQMLFLFVLFCCNEIYKDKICKI